MAQARSRTGDGGRVSRSGEVHRRGSTHAQQAAAVFGPGQVPEGALRFCKSVVRLMGLSARGRAKHSARSGSGRATEAHRGPGPARGSILGQKERRSRADRPEGRAPRPNLTNASGQGDRLAEAVALHERRLADREWLLGPGRPHTLSSRASLAYAYAYAHGQAGWMAKAIPLNEPMPTGYGCSGPTTPEPCASDYLAGPYREANAWPTRPPFTNESWSAGVGCSAPTTPRPC
jgi:hypothetical protein